MKSPQTPDNELERQSALNSIGILDTTPEERYDRITRVAKGIFEVPIVLVSLVDENRQWFKSCFGLSVSQTGRDISFCGHAILQDDIFLIEDALEDERFVDNPLVTGDPHIRFYAGCPLNYQDYRIGTLCLIDRVPKKFDDSKKSDLKALANIVEKELSAVRSKAIDEQSGVSNREGFIELGHACMEICARQRFPVSLVNLDVNISYRIDTETEQKIFKAIIRRLREVVRDLDILGRVGDNEFALLLTNCQPNEVSLLLDVYSEQVIRLLYEFVPQDYIKINTNHIELDPNKVESLDQLITV